MSGTTQSRTDHPAPSAVPSDEAAMRAIQDGHLDLLGELYRRHSQRVFAHCLRRVSDPAVADDLVQESFLRVLRYRASFRGDARFATWLYRIAANVCNDHLGGRARHAFAEGGVDPETQSEGPSPTECERIEVLRAALDRLPEEKRELLVLCRLEGLSYRQLAERLGAREGTIRVRVHRALTELKSEFESLWKEAP